MNVSFTRALIVLSVAALGLCGICKSANPLTPIGFQR